jgi:hypothetical protein
LHNNRNKSISFAYSWSKMTASSGSRQLGEHFLDAHHARLLEPTAAMAVSQLQQGHSRARVDAGAQHLADDGLEPLNAVPIRRHEQTLSHGDLVAVTLLQITECVGVDEVEQSPAPAGGAFSSFLPQEST